MNGHEYKRLVARYLLKQYGPRVQVFDEVSLGTSIIGKQRRVDLLVLEPASAKALAIECKYQDSAGTADEKLPYTLQDLATLRVPSVVVYAGAGFSEGVLHLLQSSAQAAYCLPSEQLERLPRQKGPIDSGTWQLDHILAVNFAWWDVLLAGRVPLSLPAIQAPTPAEPAASVDAGSSQEKIPGLSS
jgi:hypothetical protein